MTKQGTYNLVGMVMLPVAAVVAGYISTLNGTWEGYGATYVALLVINSLVSVPAAFFSWLLLRRSVGERPRWIAIMPTMLPAVCGSLYYLFRALIPQEVAAGVPVPGHATVFADRYGDDAVRRAPAPRDPPEPAYRLIQFFAARR